MKNYWSISLGISFVIHSAFFAGGVLPFFGNNIILNKKEIKEVRINVQEIKKKILPDSILRTAKLEQPKSPPPPYIKNIMRKLMGDDSEAASLNKPKIIEKSMNRIIITENLENAKLKRVPSYMNYYNGLRSKLESICRKNYTGESSGEVLLNFTLSRDGKLANVRGKGTSQALLDLAMKSLKEAAPFSVFPPELKEQTCPFDVSITFKNN